MAIDEIFPNPTVVEVAFEVRYPNLFYIEDKIGEFQLKIIDKFPNSSLVFNAPIIFSNVGSKGEYSLPKDIEKNVGNKTWEFESESDFKLKVSSSSLNIISNYHKTYNNDGGNKFREIIMFVLDNFLSVVKIPSFSRIGLRYIDECPIPQKDNDSFKEYYNSVLPLDRFNLSDVKKMDFNTVVESNDYYLRYIETIQEIRNEYKLILDFDGFAEKISSEGYINVVDDLHDLISAEFEETIKEPVYAYMRGETD